MRTALLNHSCIPNCILAYAGGVDLHVRTTREIHCGEELCHSYTDLCTPTRLRARALRNKYGFECTCARCHGIEYDSEDVDFLMEVRMDRVRAWAQDVTMRMKMRVSIDTV